jgi:hypothetical protein
MARKKGHGKTSITIHKASRQEHRSGQLYSNEKNSLQQIQMESCRPIKRLKKKKKKKKKETAILGTAHILRKVLTSAQEIQLSQRRK